MPQHMVNQAPRYDNRQRRQSHPHQVISKGGVIRPDKRHKPRYL